MGENCGTLAGKDREDTWKTPQSIAKPDVLMARWERHVLAGHPAPQLAAEALGCSLPGHSEEADQEEGFAVQIRGQYLTIVARNA